MRKKNFPGKTVEKSRSHKGGKSLHIDIINVSNLYHLQPTSMQVKNKLTTDPGACKSFKDTELSAPVRNPFM